MIRHNDHRVNDETATESGDPAANAADLLPLLSEALLSVPACRTGSAAALLAFASVLGRIVAHLPDGVARATLERAHNAYSAATIDPSLAGGLLERAAATLARLQKARLAMSLACRATPKTWVSRD